MLSRRWVLHMCHAQTSYHLGVARTVQNDGTGLLVAGGDLEACTYYCSRCSDDGIDLFRTQTAQNFLSTYSLACQR